MVFIWNSEQIEGFFQHSSEMVRHWAIHRALELYPDTLGDRVIGLIADSSEQTRSLILNLFAKMNLPVNNPGPLMALAQNNRSSELSSLAGAILLRSGYEQMPEQIDSIAILNYSSIIAQTERGFGLIMQAYAQGNESLIEGIAQACNLADIYHNVAQAKNTQALQKELKYFQQLWKCDISQLKHLDQPREILAVLDQALSQETPVSNISWKQGLLTELERDRARIRDFRHIAGDRVLKWSTQEKRFFTAAILCLWRNTTCGKRLVEASDTAGLFRALTLKPWQGVPSRALQDFLLPAKPDELLDSLSEALLQEDSYAGYSFVILNNLDTPGRFELFLDVYEGNKYSNNLIEAAGEALRKAGTAAAEFIIEKYPQLSEQLRIMVLFVLDSFPTPQIVNFSLKHFEDYMLSRSPQEFITFLEQVGSREFLDPLLHHWREGESQIGMVIKCLSEIHNIQNEQIKKIIQDYEKGKRNPEEFLEKPLTSFPLRCTQCGHTYNYELESIYTTIEKEGFIIGDIIQCKGCGSLETYEIPSWTHLKFMSELIRVSMAKEAHPDKELDSLETPLKLVKRVQMTTLGRKVKSVSESYHLMKEELEKHPEDAILNRRMGNVLKNGGRPDLASPYYLEAVRLNPRETESLYSMGDILIEQERYVEAISYLERMVLALRENTMDETLRRNLFASLLEQVAIIEDQTGHQVELFPSLKPDELKGLKAREPVILDLRTFDPSKKSDLEVLYQMFRSGRSPGRPSQADLILEASRSDEETRIMPVESGKKIGRNDPCPCGSGKKYKKCCGR
jgi:tetratricopeptide (TPR) repeat protein